MNNQFPNIPANLPPKHMLPEWGTARMVHGWSFEKSRCQNIETVMSKGEKIKKMLTIDLNIPHEGFAKKVNSAPLQEAEKTFRDNYPCIHGCPLCFNEATVKNPIMTLAEIWNVLDQAKELGAESSKFLGPGELTINPQIFEILEGFARRDIILLIFTKGAVFGSDDLAQHYYGMSSEEFTRRLVSYPNVRFLVGGRTFDPRLENLFIPQNKKEFPFPFDYHAARNLGLERLAGAGMNADLEKPRIAIISSPVTFQNVASVGEIYKWGAERNIPVYLPPTMDSGKGHCGIKRARDEKFERDYKDLAVEIYTWAIKRGVMSLEQFKDEGPHPYIGVAPCNQLTHGLYVHYDGEVWCCPGNDTPDFVVHPNVRTTPLAEIWKTSKNYSISKFNNGCVKDGISLPRSFYGEVRERVLRQ